MDIKVNYHKELEKLIADVQAEGRKPALLLHSCCGPCSSYVLEYLKGHFDITILFYNPNIYPEEEFLLRLNEQKRLVEEAYDNKIAILVPGYDHSEFTKAAAGYEKEMEGGKRCEKCFELRLGKTKEIAQREGFDYFGTTLTVSPHKNAALINRVGSRAADGAGVMWLYSDFKKNNGYLRSIELSGEYKLYRQRYCGCEFSL